MSKFPKLFAASVVPAGVFLLLAYNFADRFVVPMPDLPDRSEAIARYTAPPPSPLLAAVAQGATPGKFGLGRAALADEIAAWDVDVSPDGTGLPPGAGDALTGEEIFEESCAICHGSFAEGVDNWPKLAGGAGTLADEDPLKTVGSYWPYLTTVWDYVNRSMPFGNAQTLSDDDVYAIVAYILYSNDLIEDDFVLNQDNLASFEMPNAGGFIVDDRREAEYPIWTGEPCMTGCKDDVEITMRARVLDVTPQEEAAAASESTEAVELVVAAAEAPTPGGDERVADSALIASGEKVFKQCKACHQVGEDAKNRTGPVLNGVLGSTVAANGDFKYSNVFKSMAAAGVVWDEAALAAFLANPKAFAKGTRMSFRGLKKPEDIAAVTAYLSSFAK